jgi:hypothetical protein
VRAATMGRMLGSGAKWHGPEGRSHRLREGGNSNPSRNRPVRTRTPGGVGALADLTVSQGDPIRIYSLLAFTRSNTGHRSSDQHSSR